MGLLTYRQGEVRGVGDVLFGVCGHVCVCMLCVCVLFVCLQAHCSGVRFPGFTPSLTQAGESICKQRGNLHFGPIVSKRD